MANYWAIAIGINQYGCFQPLSYAQRDARVFHRFLVNEAGFPANQCVLLTDTSPAIDQSTTAPSLENIQHYVKQVSDRLQPDDFLWFFFSGYGVRVEGRDYLMPVEGDPTQAAMTGLAIETLFSTFQRLVTKNILVVLDMNRSQGTVAGEGAGAQTIDLARETGIATLLSCPPYQFSYETIALRQGLFTTALLEALRYHGCVTLEQLAQYLSHRLPELSEHHWRPIQQPVCLIPADRRYELLLPGKVMATVGATSSHEGSSSGNFPQGYYTGRLETAPHPAPMVVPDRPSQNGSVNGAVSSEAAIDPVADEAFWKNFRLWTSLIILALLLLVVWRLRGALVGGESTPTPSPNPTQTTDAGTAQPLSPPVTNGNTNPNEPSDSNNPNDSSNDNDGQQTTGLGEADRPLPGNESGSNSGNPTNPSPPVTTQDLNTTNPSPATTNSSSLNAARVLLTRPRASSRANQVSDFVEAINKARQIRPNQPNYQLAQQDIDRWSQVILDMANGRAAQPNNGSAITAAQNLSSAIAAARLVPSDRSALYRSAQASVAQWSQQILGLANARAAAQDFNQAIQIARQIPRNTPTYNAAQQAIATWQTQVY